MAITSVCRIYGSIVSPSGQDATDSTCIFSVNLPPVVSAASGVTSGEIDSTTDSSGYFYIDLIQGLSYKVRIPSLNIRQVFTVPDDSSAELFEQLGLT